MTTELTEDGERQLRALFEAGEIDKFFTFAAELVKAGVPGATLVARLESTPAPLARHRVGSVPATAISPADLSGLEVSDEELIEAYNGGLTIRGVSKKFGLGYGLTRYRLDGLVTIRQGRPAQQPMLRQDIVDAYTNGATIRAIAHDTGLSYGTVHRLLEPHVEFRPRGTPR